MRKFLWVTMAALAIIIGLYPTLYFIIEMKFGLLNTKSKSLLENTLWNVAFYSHILFGGLALLIGWIQFSSKIRNKNLTLHRRIGMLYFLAVMISALAGIYIGFYATGGLPASAGFISLGIIWLSTTIMAYNKIRKMQVIEHQKMMIYSYAACFAAVTLRIWLPILTAIFGDFIIAYTIVAWLCWVPNLLIAYKITDRLTAQNF